MRTVIGLEIPLRTPDKFPDISSSILDSSFHNLLYIVSQDWEPVSWHRHQCLQNQKRLGSHAWKVDWQYATITVKKNSKVGHVVIYCRSNYRETPK